MSDDSSNRTDVSTIHLDNISLQNRENVDTNTKFVGFDLSTQQLKAIVIDDKLKVCHQVSVDFDTELSEYKTRGGAHRRDDGSNGASAPVNMWLKALDLCLDKLKIDGLDFGTVLGISGCAQQHGSVWWRRESANLLANLNPDEFLHKELLAAFSVRDSPIWMDSSTSEQCARLEAHVGGPARLAELTGSRAYERFTGPQIARIFRFRREAYLVTERITLVSNFLASLLIGAYAPLDASDASGMNMMDIRRKRWSDECLEGLLADAEGGPVARLDAELAGLRARLGCSDGTPHTLNNNIVDTHEVVGRVSRYFVERYGLPPECLVSSFTGDNPASMAGLCVKPDELVLSLGTSDTAFFWLAEPKPGLNGHVLRNPLDDESYMGLICFKNGSKTRERIRDTFCSGEWAEFERLLGVAPPGNLGHIGFYYDLREIYPLARGDFRYNKLNERLAGPFGAPELEARACLEGQFMRLYHHTRALGLDMARIRRVLVTGGASANRAILQVIADIFKSPVYTLESLANSASLGGAYLAKYAYELEQQKLDQSFQACAGMQATAEIEMDCCEGCSCGAATEPENSVRDLLDPLAACESEKFDPHEQLDKQIDFSRMILGGNEATAGEEDEDCREINLVKMAEPVCQSGVYEELLERYVQLETEIACNNAG